MRKADGFRFLFSRDKNIKPIPSLEGIEIRMGESMLLEAARSGDESQVRVHIKEGADVNQVDKHGETALIIASCLGYEKVVAELLQVPGIQVNKKTPEGWTALVAAADKGHHAVVRKLLEHPETDPNTRDKQEQTVLMGLSGLLDHTAVIHELLSHPDTDILAQVISA
ncbi:kinase D-interacting substrate of 220 kDa [Eurytemora carolleeae]|uniref:kinase D-interacting substrate of 220 kDa n=1 Tax=Eurytemora carolleeae TaxID=1294199 RepID=UPI000C78BD51|nr:kinase D-interacting substrate of 220 kDa [Eurytemora carolleeae]|eukprot:XP_023328645.1 kinase D-interacting substrate of 220 kDa-like [Eurytemora affinis]